MSEIEECLFNPSEVFTQANVNRANFNEKYIWETKVYFKKQVNKQKLN